MRLRHLHGVLHGPRKRPGVDDATSGQQPLVLVVEEHAVDALLAGSLLVVGEHLQYRRLVPIETNALDRTSSVASCRKMYSFIFWFTH